MDGKRIGVRMPLLVASSSRVSVSACVTSLPPWHIIPHSQGRGQVSDLPVRDLRAPDLPVRDLPVAELPVRDLPVPELPVPKLRAPELRAPEVRVPELPAQSCWRREAGDDPPDRVYCGERCLLDARRHPSIRLSGRMRASWGAWLLWALVGV